MPWRPRRACAVHGNLVASGGRCPNCAKAYDLARPWHFAFYTSLEWRTVRQQVLEQHPLCAVAGCGARATDVDHIIARRRRPDLALALWNLRALCHACHARHTHQGPVA